MLDQTTTLPVVVEANPSGVTKTALLFTVEKLGVNVKVAVGAKADRTAWLSLVPEITRPVTIAVPREGYTDETMKLEDGMLTMRELNSMLAATARQLEDNLKKQVEEGTW